MTATEILTELERRGVHLEVAGDKLRWRPKEAVTPELMEVLKHWKPEIIAVLSSSKTTGKGKCPGPERCGGCYEVSPGVHLHPPKISEEWKAWLAKWEPKKGNAVQ